MSSKLKKREEIILNMLKFHGIEYKGVVLLTLWDLADNINNTWYAEHFCNPKNFKSISSGGFVLAEWCLHELFRAIRWTAKRSEKIQIFEGLKNKAEFVLVDQGVLYECPRLYI